MINLFGLEFTWSVLLLGLVTGSTYGLLAVGLVLIYRANRIINFAHGAIGGLGAALLGLMVVQLGVPYWLAFVVALFACALVGAVVEAAVVRRLRNAPRLMSIIATLGFAQFFFLLTLAIFSQVQAGTLFPQPVGLPQFTVGALLFTRAHFAIVFFTPLIVTALAFFLRKSHFGIGIRAAASNADAARAAGIFPSRMSSLSWSMAGAIAAFTAILVFPTLGFLPIQQLGPSLLLRALVPAVIARMTSFPVALVAGMSIGVMEAVLLFSFARSGVVDALLFGVVLVILMLQTGRGAREKEKGTWTAVEAWKPLPDALNAVRSIRNLGRIMAVIGLGLAVLVPVLLSAESTAAFIEILILALVGLSITLITGLGGDLSLGQFAVAGIGATASYYVASRTGNFLLAFPVAAAAGGVVSILLGIPALRIRGLMLSVSTLAFALMAYGWLFQQPWMLGEGVDTGRPILGGFALDTSKRYYFLVLALFVLALWLARNLRSSGFGRSLIALRDNEDSARTFAIRAVRTRLQAYALGGALAGLAGALFAHSLSRITSDYFPPEASFNVAALSVLGGLGVLVGSLLGALFIVGIPAFVPLDSAGLAGTAFGWLALILYAPGGIAQMLRPSRDRLLGFLARRAGVEWTPTEPGDEQTSHAATAGTQLEQSFSPSQPLPDTNDRPPVILEVKELTKAYGGVTAIDEVAMEVHKSETLGIIGPNGAGKTTLFDVVSGFVSPDAGAVLLAGRDITRASPEARAKLGLVRSFQDGALFETLTVLDAIRLARERVEPTHLAAAVLGLREGERVKEADARDLIHVMGLEPFRTKQIRELSTGTRRITELACLLALEPKVLLLDEPSSGIAQRESEALGDLLSNVRRALDATLVVIEHDIPLVMSLSDRVIAMAEGKVIATGSPSDVQQDPQVIESYLGSDVGAIQRSGVVPEKIG